MSFWQEGVVPALKLSFNVDCNPGEDLRSLLLKEVSSQGYLARYLLFVRLQDLTGFRFVFFPFFFFFLFFLFFLLLIGRGIEEENDFLLLNRFEDSESFSRKLNCQNSAVYFHSMQLQSFRFVCLPIFL